MPPRGLIALAMCVLAGGCVSEDQARRVLRTDDPRNQTAMMAYVARERMTGLTGDLIRLLEAEDQGVRFMAATALHKLTDIDLGFHFARGEAREAVVAEWHRWYEAKSGNPVPDWEPETPAGEDEASEEGEKDAVAEANGEEEIAEETPAAEDAGATAPEAETGATATPEAGSKTFLLPEIERADPGTPPETTKETAG